LLLYPIVTDGYTPVNLCCKIIAAIIATILEVIYFGYYRWQLL